MVRHIEWADVSVNFWTGCQRISDGCTNCYMFREQESFGQTPTLIARTGNATFNAALKWKEPKKISVCNWSDFFIKEADLWRDDAWNVIRQTPHHTWIILTKRPERIQQFLPSDWGTGWGNVWLGVSIEKQKYLNRADILALIPAKKRFISFEPILGSIDVTKITHLNKIDWCILGGEIGNLSGGYKFRPSAQSWIDKIITDLSGTGIKIFINRLGSYEAYLNKFSDKQGSNISEWPLHLQIRNMP